MGNSAFAVYGGAVGLGFLSGGIVVVAGGGAVVGGFEDVGFGVVAGFALRNVTTAQEVKTDRRQTCHSSLLVYAFPTQIFLYFPSSGELFW